MRVDQLLKKLAEIDQGDASAQPHHPSLRCITQSAEAKECGWLEA